MSVRHPADDHDVVIRVRGEQDGKRRTTDHDAILAGHQSAPKGCRRVTRVLPPELLPPDEIDRASSMDLSRQAWFYRGLRLVERLAQRLLQDAGFVAVG